MMSEPQSSTVHSPPQSLSKNKLRGHATLISLALFNNAYCRVAVVSDARAAKTSDLCEIANENRSNVPHLFGCRETLSLPSKHFSSE